MNVLFLSPHFPPHYYLFCARLHALGACVLGLGDQPYESLSPELRTVLTEYYRVPDLNDYDAVLRAAGYFTHQYGKLDRVDSLNEHWLETEARLRTDFNIDGFKVDHLPAIKRKSAMKQRFAQAGLATPRGRLVYSPADARALVAEVGYPLVAKPDIGVGANRTYKICEPADLEHFLAHAPPGYLIEEFVQGAIETFDGLADRNGNPAFFTSMRYSSGVMEVVAEDIDIYYYTLRALTPDMIDAGRRCLAAFGVRERFFHFEFFRGRDGRLVALEVNMRPAGGLTLDMYNLANDIDLYQAWATMLVNGSSGLHYTWPYHVCYAGRKYGRPYVYRHDEILVRWGQYIVLHQPMPELFHRAMGAYAYIIRSPDEAEVIAIAEAIQAVRASDK